MVYLVGAGPGDPGLLTLRGAAVLAKAETVVYDHLAPLELLSLAPKEAKLIDAGKESFKRSLSQEAINETLAAEAQAGRVVVRLKGGDPYIFGRGGEEALYLASLGLAFEVVPGVSATVAVAAAAGIPLTHRGLSQTATLATGHAQEGGAGVDFTTLTGETLAVVMGRQNLALICESLIKGGRSAQTLAAAIEWGATPKQRTITGSLATLPSLVEAANLRPPTLLVVGAVVGLRDQLNWFEKRPLFGRTILVTRTKAQAGRLSELLKEAGAKVLERPAIAIHELSPNPELLAALKSLGPGGPYRYLVFTSPNGADLFLKALWARGQDARALAGLAIVVMGPGTAAALRPYGLKPDHVPAKTYQAEGLLDLFQDLNLPPGPVLWPRAATVRPTLAAGLNAMGFKVDEVVLYQCEPGPLEFLNEDLASTPVDLATITSASVATYLGQALNEANRKALKVVAIGPIASMAAQKAGLTVVAVSKVATIESLASAILDYFPKRY
ncbi:MAG: uroporphyrinogen-III C-methyltransferase [Deltaproteobacteria bacterium]|nr:uroporphyrinogen-III C-methyltransferase [Deltaproteobacteria bacterium]